ncbi:hypothetical protein QBC35DRAFT_390972 [Podospora australis]|uniref:Uncharacterized protein n=1 Tax=Podospora australis TaxID=1536484 RepID=A0AAN6WMW5_9PEZI|nr:hypothetical protein QBC35DRAFT_390972 [Podospora australis]
MRVTTFVFTLYMALAAAAPEMTLEKAQERLLCVCNERRCLGPACCANGSC